MMRILTILLFSALALTSVVGSDACGQAEPNTTCWKGVVNNDGTGGNLQCEIKEVPGELTGTATMSHTVTTSGGRTRRVEDGSITYERSDGNAPVGSGPVTDHFQFSADGQSMTHTHTEYNPDGSIKGTTTQGYTKDADCKDIKKAKKKNKQGSPH